MEYGLVPRKLLALICHSQLEKQKIAEKLHFFQQKNLTVLNFGTSRYFIFHCHTILMPNFNFTLKQILLMTFVFHLQCKSCRKSSSCHLNIAKKVKLKLNNLDWMLHHVTYVFQSESPLYSCLNVKELLVQNRSNIKTLSDSSGIWTHNHLILKWTLNYLAKLWLDGWVFAYKLCGCRFQSRCCRLNNLQCRTKYLEENRVIQQNWIGEEKFGICFCVFFNWYWQSPSSWRETRHYVSNQIWDFSSIS